MRATFALLLALPLALPLALTACVGGRSPEARFFQLQPSADVMPPAVGLDPSVSVLVKTVALEAYLRQPQMAIRVRPHEVEYNEFTRWAEPLERNIARVITENLRRALKSDHVAMLPHAQEGGRVYTLQVEVKRFEGQPDSKVQLSASWILHREPETAAAKVGAVDLVGLTGGTSAEDLAEAQSKLLAELCRRIAADIEALASSAPAASP